MKKLAVIFGALALASVGFAAFAAPACARPPVVVVHNHVTLPHHYAARYRAAVVVPTPYYNPGAGGYYYQPGFVPQVIGGGLNVAGNVIGGGFNVAGNAVGGILGGLFGYTYSADGCYYWQGANWAWSGRC